MVQVPLRGAHNRLVPENANEFTRFTSIADEAIRFCGEPRPLRRVYFLQDGGVEKTSITPMIASEALTKLSEHSFLLDIEERELIANHFDRPVETVKLPIFVRLDYPSRFEECDSIRRASSDDLEVDV